MMKLFSIVTALFIVIGTNSPAIAEEIEVPQEELARESTLPVFSKRRAVLNRSVLNLERFEFGLGAGLEMNEPFYNDLMGSAQLTYNFTEISAVNIQGLYWAPGLSSYGVQLKNGGKFAAFDAAKAPHPLWALIVNYEFIAYYGKISLTKQGVMNLNLFGLAGAGYLSMNKTGTPVFNLGLGQNFFVTNNVGIRWDLRWLIFQGPNATTQPLDPKLNDPDPSSFSKTMFYNTQMGLSLVFIL